jgi:hypothetical protein
MGDHGVRSHFAGRQAERSPMGRTSSGGGAARPPRQQSSARESALIAKYGESRFAMAKEVTPLLVRLLGKDGLPSISKFQNSRSRSETLAQLAEEYHLDEEAQAKVAAMYDQVQMRPREQYESDVAFLAENQTAVMERLLAGDALRREKISEGEYQEILGRLDPRVAAMSAVRDAKGTDLTITELMGEEEFVTGLRSVLDPGGVESLEEQITDSVEIAAAHQALLEKRKSPEPISPQTLEELDQTVSMATKMVGTARDFLNTAETILQEEGRTPGK